MVKTNIDVNPQKLEDIKKTKSKAKSLKPSEISPLQKLTMTKMDDLFQFSVETNKKYIRYSYVVPLDTWKLIKEGNDTTDISKYIKPELIPEIIDNQNFNENEYYSIHLMIPNGWRTYVSWFKGDEDWKKHICNNGEVLYNDVDGVPDQILAVQIQQSAVMMSVV